MTDPNTPGAGEDASESGAGAGVQRPDEGETNPPGQTPGGPASGGEGAAGSGDAEGFGSGT
jgi:hypothetical protein